MTPRYLHPDGPALRSARIAARLTQLGLAQRAHQRLRPVSLRTIWSAEQGQRIRRLTLLRLLHVLGVPEERRQEYVVTNE